MEASAARGQDDEPWRYSRRGERLPDHCLDCGALMLGGYCATCGQKNEPEHRSLWQLVKDAVGPAVLLEGKLWRTLGTLLFRPGALTVAYTEGKRSRYIRPLRLYFWVSVVFFSLLALTSTRVVTVKFGKEDRIQIPFAPELERRLQEKLDALKETDPSPPHGGAASQPADAGADKGAYARERLRQEFLSRLPKAIVLLLPVFALLLKALWWRRPYVEHLVFALHAHSVLFMGLGVQLAPWAPLKALGLLFPVVWFFIAARRFYGNGWPMTVLKVLTLGVIDGVISVLAVLGTVLVALLGS